MSAATESAAFVRLTPGTLDSTAAGSATVDIKTRTFLDQFGQAFGLQDHDQELVLARQDVDATGRGRTRYRQVHRGVPVFGAELTSHFNRDGQLVAVSASTFEITDLDITPRFPLESAATIARNHVARQGSARARFDRLSGTNPELVIFRSGLARGVPGLNHLAYRIEVVNDSRSVREFVFVDAHSGKVLDRISGIHQALDRKIYEDNLGEVVWQDSEDDPDPIPAAWADGEDDQVQDWQDEINGAKETYNLFSSMTAGAWRSYDSADATMRTINNDPNIACPNATWNGNTTNYCHGVTADDTVAHEWGHAYMDYTANLIYQWQAGALNESYSDIWGEVVDLLNGRGLDSPGGLRTDGSCSTFGIGSPSVDGSYRWLAGEDNPSFNGALRDMWRPNCYGDPGRVSDSRYLCSAFDNGGVHTNSGVPNHAFALLVDGGSYNGQTITGLGLTKAAHIYWESMQMLVPASNFFAQADALEASCAMLAGDEENLRALSTSTPNTGLSGIVITEADCAQVAAVIEAVELRVAPTQCNFKPLLDVDPPPRCLDRGDLESFAFTDWESGLGGWTAGTYGVADPLVFSTDDWAVVGDLPNGRDGSAAFVANVNSLSCDDGDETGVLTLNSPPITIPPDSKVARFSIDHYFSSEADWDGGNLKLSVNGGAYELVPPEWIDVSPYNKTLYPLEDVGNTNPLAGQEAYSGGDGGSVAGSWGQTQVSLAAGAGAGDEIRLRLDFGVDRCVGTLGWFVDEVEFYSCSDEFSPLCGNGMPDPNEQCDDGNKDDGDGCSAICEVEANWQCSDAVPSMEIPDYGFEAGQLGGVWTESSLIFRTPICSVGICGDGEGSGPADGVYWAWFGGLEPGEYDEAAVSQNITIPATAENLRFDLEIPHCDSAADYLELRVDGNVVFEVDGADAACGSVGYVEQRVDITPYADGGVHTIEFYSEHFTDNGANTNFFVDNVLIANQPSVCIAAGPIFNPAPAAGSTINFGDQVIIAPSAPLGITVANSGVEALELNCSITGAGASEFNLVSCPSPVPASGDALVEVNCVAGSLGPKSATLEIATNDPAVPLAGFTLSCVGVNAPQQVVTPVPLVQLVPANGTAAVAIHYAPGNGVETLEGLTLRVHWNSSKLSLDEFTSVWSPDLVSQDAACQADDANFDNDSQTDCFATIAWNSGSDNFPGAGNTPTPLATANFTAAFSPAESTRVRFSAASTATGYVFWSNSALVEEETVGPQVLFLDDFEAAGAEN